MIRIPIDLKDKIPYQRLEAMHIAECASRFDSAVILTDSKATINLKSVIGLLSMAISGQEKTYLECNGPDEAEAAEAVQEALRKSFTA